MLKNGKYKKHPSLNYPFKKSGNNYLMTWDVLDAYDHMFPIKNNFSSFSYKVKCQCGFSKTEFCFSKFLSCMATSESLNSRLDKFDSENKGRTVSCSNCKAKLSKEIEYFDILVIQFGFMGAKVEIPIDEIPLTLTTSNNSFSFKFLVNFINNNDSSTNHFDCYCYNYKEKKFYNIDDLGQKENKIDKPSFEKVNPKIICYFKN
jgi:hypothetical protein